MNSLRRVLLQRYLKSTKVTTRYYGALDFEELKDVSEKTRVDIASKAEVIDPLFLTGYVVGGFKFHKTTVSGPVGIIDKAVFGWNVKSASEITVESLALFYMMYPKLDIIIIGTGDEFVPLSPSIHKDLKSRGISIEVQRTTHACGILNLLKAQSSQKVGAALLPITTSCSTSSTRRVPPQARKIS